MMKPTLHTAAPLVMMMMMMVVVMVVPGILTQHLTLFPLRLRVENHVMNLEPQEFRAEVLHRGILLGAMKRLMEANSDFKFTYTEDLNYGPYLESVNGLAGSTEDQTYWQLLRQTPTGQTRPTDVGIGCYIPGDNETIILRFTKY